jgi:Zn-dependent protease
VLIAEPQPSQYDVHFNLGNIAVRVHPLFWVLALMFGALNTPQDFQLYEGILLWTAAVGSSILVHELGHALAAKAYGWLPRIVLYAMGGLAIYNPTRQTRTSRILIDFAGPGAGFVLGGLVIAAALLSGHSVMLFDIHIGSGPRLGGRLGLFVYFMLLVNFFWGLLNLLPIQPLDGGGIAKALLEKYRPRDAWTVAFQLSIATSVVMAIVSIALWKNAVMLVLFSMFAYQSWQTLQQLRQFG